jgi:hypothetical protein
MARITLIVLFAAAVFLAAVVVMNPDYFFPDASTGRLDGNTKKSRGGTPADRSTPADCPSCPLPSN